MKNDKVSAKALIPFLVFVGVYLITGIVLNAQGTELAFYQLPSPVAAIIGIIVAFIMFKGSIEEKFDSLIKGCGNENIIIMCIIFLLAGAFSTVSKQMGGVDSVVNLGMSVLPPQYITVGIFIISCFIAISTGTSVGTVVAVAPIAIGFAQAAGISEAMVIGATISGGIILSGIIGISDGSFTALVFSQQIFEGFKGMLDIFLLSMFTGGLAYMVEREGGINWIIKQVRKIIKGKKSAELGISAMVSLTDLATANNTVAILINGPIAKEISEEYGIEPKRAASLLDIFSCVFQGLIPYGA